MPYMGVNYSQQTKEQTMNYCKLCRMGNLNCGNYSHLMIKQKNFSTLQTTATANMDTCSFLVTSISKLLEGVAPGLANTGDEISAKKLGRPR